MNRNHWSGYSEGELARMRRGGRVHATSRRVHASHALAPDVTAQTKAVLDGLRAPPEPAYPPQWLPEIQAAQTPADWMNDNAPDPHEHRNGTPAPSEPPSDAYPAEWLYGLGEDRGGALGGEGFLNRRAA